MKKIMLATAVLALSAGAAFAENPNLGTPADLHANIQAQAAQNVDYTPTASISTANPAADRFGDASPAKGE
ncbi:hypothetical protein [Phyllobacterium leguminum]|uniref:DUF680 domain-containing protein n=1 Tax=Phyllobacterium leguminum TaxID=314237 RepID=A0A318T3Z1_9HYPH|nr:hypothetical protein [Phyllobacterium leguminum]PYE87581.1 hypothetical protein C7477_11283 [Phyllobacterium leguminum]